MRAKRSMVEGASDAERRCRRRITDVARAPSTTLRVVPLPRYRGAGCLSRRYFGAAGGDFAFCINCTMDQVT